MNSTADKRYPTRLEGLDFARFLAFVGMVLVNFRIVMGAETDDDILGILVGSLQGKAAATFVVLAGIGFGLAAARMDYAGTVSVTIRRALFLLALGLINSLIFEADILHYIAHILVGMGTLEALGMLGGQSSVTAVVAAFLFCLFALIFALLWSRFFKRGPIEQLMRKLAG